MNFKMGLGRQGLVLGILFSFLFNAVAFGNNAPEATIRHFVVNGLNVYFINTHSGNGVALTANVRTGSWNDEPVHHAGRAHLWEHVIHAGSKKFPGQSTFDLLTSRMGVDTNAYTSNERIFYHGYLHPDGLREWAALLGAMLSDPEWNEKTFLLEKGAVKDEAATYQKQDDTALQGSIFLNLLPPGHPLAMYDVGTQDQLNAMTLRDLQDLFYSNYNAENLAVVLAGNFDTLPDGSIPLTEEAALQIIRENFKLPVPDPSLNLPLTEPLRKKVFPSIVDSSAPARNQLIEIGGTSGARTLQLTFEVDQRLAEQHPGALETLTDYLNLDMPGSLQDILKKKGWILGMGVYTSSINNLTLVNVDFSLSEGDGAQHRYDVPDLLFSTLNDIKAHGFRADLLEYLKARNIESYRQVTFEAKRSAELFAKALSHVKDPQRAFDFEGQYGSVTNDQIREAASKAFPVEKMIGGYVGPEISSSSTTERAPIFDRPLVHVTDPSIVTRWKNLSEGRATAADSVNVQISRVDLPFSHVPQEGPSQPARVLELKLKGVSAALEEQHALTAGGFWLKLTLAPVSLSTAAALEVFMEAFRERYKSEFDYMGSMGVNITVGYGNGTIGISGRGNAQASLAAQEWVVEHLATFSPTSEEVAHAQGVLELGFQQAQQDFPARIARSAASSLLERYSYLNNRIVAASKRLDASDVKQKVAKALDRVDFAAAFTGDYTQTTVEVSLTKMRRILPHALHAKQRRKRARTSLPLRNTTAYWHQIQSEEPNSQIGIARLYQGPQYEPALLREHAALTVLEIALGREVYQLNRARRGLGYVHNASTFSTAGGRRIAFLGQTDGEKRFPEIEEGWSVVLSTLENGTISEDGFASEKTGAYRAGKLLPSHFGSAAARLFASFNLTGNPQWDEQETALIPTLTPSEITEIGLRYLRAPQHLSVIASNIQPAYCERLLLSEDSARLNVVKPAE